MLSFSLLDLMYFFKHSGRVKVNYLHPSILQGTYLFWEVHLNIKLPWLALPVNTCLYSSFPKMSWRSLATASVKFLTRSHYLYWIKIRTFYNWSEMVNKPFCHHLKNHCISTNWVMFSSSLNFVWNRTMKQNSIFFLWTSLVYWTLYYLISYFSHC